jgi:hypothetical protein
MSDWQILRSLRADAIGDLEHLLLGQEAAYMRVVVTTPGIVRGFDQNV